VQGIDDVAEMEMPGRRRRETRYHLPIRIAATPFDPPNPPLDGADADPGT
jgi:hypothetical protein